MSFAVIIVKIRVKTEGDDRKTSHFSHAIINKLNRKRIKSIGSKKLCKVSQHKATVDHWPLRRGRVKDAAV